MTDSEQALAEALRELEGRLEAQRQTIEQQRERIAELVRDRVVRNTEKVVQPAKLLEALQAVGIEYQHARNTWNGRKKLTDALYDWQANGETITGRQQVGRLAEDCHLPAAGTELGPPLPDAADDDDKPSEETIYAAVRFITTDAPGVVSLSMVQRALQLTYCQAADLIETLERRKMIGPREGVRVWQKVLGVCGQCRKTLREHYDAAGKWRWRHSYQGVPE